MRAAKGRREMRMEFDKAETRRAVELLKPGGALFEVRIIDGRWNASGYFTDANQLEAALSALRGRKHANVYFTLNHVRRECYCRSQRDGFTEYAAPTTSDGDIEGYEWLMVDIDPERAAGTSSSAEEILAAKRMANRVYSYLKERGWEEPVAAESGNGIHLLYAVRLKNTPDNARLVNGCLRALGMLFSDSATGIDLKTGNPARVCKLYGTMARKGADTPERPHRMSRIIRAPEEIRRNDRALLESLCAVLPEEAGPADKAEGNAAPFDLEDWIAAHGLRVSQKTVWNGGTKWILEECPFDSGHKGKDAAIIRTGDGKICFHCFHNSCADKHWRELRLKFEPEAYGRQYVEPYRKPNRERPPLAAENRAGPAFYTATQLLQMKLPPDEFIRTGIGGVDKRLRGLKKGFVTCLSGLRGCGKSSLISQLALEAAEQGYRAALFSGELTERNTLEWLMLQAAGRRNVAETQFEGYYRVAGAAREKISKWLDGRVYIYNNSQGNECGRVLAHMKQCAEQQRADLVILDNLMALDISLLDRDRFQRQSLFVEQLEDFAKRYLVHIVFVAHPRKSGGFLRLDDVSGSGDIVNRVDNAFILHRVNSDFKRLARETFRWREGHPLYACSNVLEICKDRGGGVQDVFVPLYFEPESKRLKNTAFENKQYSWEAALAREGLFETEEMHEADGKPAASGGGRNE